MSRSEPDWPIARHDKTPVSMGVSELRSGTIPPAVRVSSPLDRGHDRDCLPGLDRIIALDEFQARADKDRFIVRAQRWGLSIKWFQQRGPRLPLCHFDAGFGCAGEIPQLGIELHVLLHPFDSAIKSFRRTPMH